jgi:hypothetical protein
LDACTAPADEDWIPDRVRVMSRSSLRRSCFWEDAASFLAGSAAGLAVLFAPLDEA